MAQIFGPLIAPILFVNSLISDFSIVYLDSLAFVLLILFLFFFRRRQLPSIEEAWNLPISAEMSSRQQQQQQQPGGSSYNKYGVAPTVPPPPYPQGQSKRFKVKIHV